MSDEQVPAETTNQVRLSDALIKFIKSLGEWRDRALVIAGIFYVAGYGMWSWYALENNLGFLPALQFQYFVAGIPVILGLVVIYVVWKLLAAWNNKLETGQTWFWVFLRTLFRIGAIFVGVGILYAIMGPSITILVFLGIVLLFSFSKLSLLLIKITPYSELPENKKIKRAFWIVGMLSLAMIAVVYHNILDKFLFFRLLQRFPQDTVDTWVSLTLGVVILFGGNAISYVLPAEFIKAYRVFYFLLFSVVFAMLFFPFYKDKIYTKLPQEFGGVLPRCAYLDIKVENLSSDTHQTLFRTTSDDSTPPVLRTVQLDILFTSTSVLMARPHTDTGEQGVVYEIPRSNVQSITWCK